jgi:translation initiation factor 3 subunit D
VKAEWGDPALTLDFSSFQGIRSSVPTSETLAQHGVLERFNSTYTRLTARQEKPLERQWAVERKFYQVTTSDDPVIATLLADKAGTVFTTDAILSTLMTALKSHFSWDVIVRKRGGLLIFDKREDSGLDLLTVNENSHDPPGDEAEIAANTQDALTKEATLLTLNLSQQVLEHEQETKLTLEHLHPFAEKDEHTASVGYLYRRFTIGDSGERLVVRCEVDAYKPRANGSGNAFVLVRALNEFDVKVTGGWRQKLEAQRAGTFATEVRNNNCKLHKWALQAHFAEAEAIELAYVTRTTMRDPYSHVLLGVEERARPDFLRDLGADVGALWGVLVRLLEALRALPDDASYILVREPNKKQLSVYKVPDDEFTAPLDA